MLFGDIFELLPSKAGIKKALSESAAYPYGFGLAIAGLIQKPGDRPPADEFSIGDYVGEDHLGSLDDLRKGTANTWWRKL